MLKIIWSLLTLYSQGGYSILFLCIAFLYDLTYLCCVSASVQSKYFTLWQKYTECLLPMTQLIYDFRTCALSYFLFRKNKKKRSLEKLTVLGVQLEALEKNKAHA